MNYVHIAGFALTFAGGSMLASIPVAAVGLFVAGLFLLLSVRS